MTPGPASRIVRELPREEPHPDRAADRHHGELAQRESALSSGELSGGFARADVDAIEPRLYTLFLLAPNHVTEHLSELVNLLDGVVVENRCPDDAGVETLAEMLHQPRRVHVSVANADAAVRIVSVTNAGNMSGRLKQKVGTRSERRAWSPPRRRWLLQLAALRASRERGRFVLAYGSHGANDGVAPRCGFGASLL